jgi:hypothetical protein
MAVEDEDQSGDEGLSTPQKVVAGAAIGVAIPAAVGVAKKLLSDGGDDENGGESPPRTRSRSTRSSGRVRKTGARKTAARKTGSARKTSARKTAARKTSARKTAARGSRGRR